MNHVAHTAYACLCFCSFVRVRTFSCCCYVSAVRCSCAVSVLRAARRCVAVPEAGARSGAPCASEQHFYGATRMIAATMSRAGAGAVAPQPAPRLVWGWFARARGAASWACSSGASWCSATRLRSRIDPAGMCTGAALAARIEPPLRPARPARSAAGLQQRQQRQPPSRAAHAAADRQRRGKVPAAAQRAVVAVSLRGQE